MEYEKQLISEKITLLEEALRELDEETFKLEEEVKNKFILYKNKFVAIYLRLENYYGYLSNICIYDGHIILEGVFIKFSQSKLSIVKKLGYNIKEIPLTNSCISEIPKDDLLNKVNNSLIKTLFDILCHEN